MQPSVVVIMLDALRADCAPGAADSAHLRSLGLKPPQMPALSRLVSGAYTFTQAIACAPYTTACTASILTGLLPPEHGVRAFSTTSLSREVRTLPAILATHGYATCAMSDRPQVLQPMGLLRDMQTIVAAEDDALAWWDSYAAAPRFLFLHLWDAHKPYGMPVARAFRAAQPTVRQWTERLRAASIAPPTHELALDDDQERQLVYQMQYAWEDTRGFKAGLEAYIEGLRIFDAGRLSALVAALDHRGVLGDSIVVTLADHGEGRDRPPSQRMCHGSTLLDDQLRIPLYISLPPALGDRKGHLPPAVTGGEDHLPPALGGEGGVIPAQVSEADVAPTILDALEMLDERTAGRSAYNGRSLLPLLRGEALPERPAYAEFWTLTHTPAAGDPQFHPDVSPVLRLRMVRYPDHKYILAGQPLPPHDALAGLPPREIVRRLARDMLGRPESAADDAAWLPILTTHSIPPTERLARLLRQIEASDEFRRLHKHALYDLRRDPLETKPTDAQADAALWADFSQRVAIMNEIAGAARQGEPILTNEADEQVILKRLQDLGYVE
jgi:arylsulfatase A-like enzyme